jgi:hypothetical protein
MGNMRAAARINPASTPGIAGLDQLSNRLDPEVYGLIAPALIPWIVLLPAPPRRGFGRDVFQPSFEKFQIIEADPGLVGKCF